MSSYTAGGSSHSSLRVSRGAGDSAALRSGVSSALIRWRQALTWGLGLIWLLDAALQYQPYMFGTDFPSQVIAPTGQGSPIWIQAPVTWSAHLMEHHIILWNAVFATVQLAIAVGILWRRTLRLALAASIVWALLVWWLGEGLGGLFAGPVMPIMGLPGAVLIYAFIAVLVWPRGSTSGGSSGAEEPLVAESVAAGSPLGAVGSKLVWLVLWALFVWEQVRPANRSSSMLREMVGGMGSGEPGWMKSINNWTATELGENGAAISVLLVIVFAALAISVFLPWVTRPVLVVGVLVSLFFWVAAEDIGAIATGNATDPNSGLPLVLLMLCFWPISRGLRQSTPTQPEPSDAVA